MRKSSWSKVANSARKAKSIAECPYPDGGHRTYWLDVFFESHQEDVEEYLSNIEVFEVVDQFKGLSKYF